jgi:hypothetical protein
VSLIRQEVRVEIGRQGNRRMPEAFEIQLSGGKCSNDSKARRMRLLGTAALASAIVLTWAGCGSGGGTNPSAPTCGAAFIPVVQQLYPMPGATDVSPAVGEMVLASSSEATEIWLDEVPHHGVAIPTHPRSVPNPLPSPAATPGPDGTTTFAVAFRQLKAHKKYLVEAAEQQNPNCVADPHPFIVQIGTLTTQ